MFFKKAMSTGNANQMQIGREAEVVTDFNFLHSKDSDCSHRCLFIRKSLILLDKMLNCKGKSLTLNITKSCFFSVATHVPRKTRPSKWLNKEKSDAFEFLC